MEMKKVLLMILDGWGIAENKDVSAIDKANTPFMDSLYGKYANSKLNASGLFVGLPDGQMGNSEVGHMNIGAGRVVYQDLVKVTKAIEDGTLAKNQEIIDAFNYAKEGDRKVHFLGLVSDGGVHSHIDHLKGLCTMAQESGLNKVFVHAYTDGRDCDPKSGLGFIQELEDHMAATGAQMASLTGRYYAMDRDNRWERVELAYDAMVKGEGKRVVDISEAIQQSYDEGVTDEFIKPIIKVDDEGNPVACIEDGDVVLFFNFRTDRGRQVTQALSQKDFREYDMRKLDLYYITMTNYDDTFQNVKVIFDKENLQNTLGEVLERNQKKQIRIAETEKYPHVTFFFSGGRETEFEGESRILCPSPKVATYDLKPEMSAEEIRDSIIPELNKGEVDFICLNFANPDMVGHTGVFEAAVKACETVDSCTEKVVEAAIDNGYATIIIADHGNSDKLINEDGSPNTAHTTNPVPCILVDPDFEGTIKDGKLGDLAPTILTMMGIDIPEEMTGEVLVENVLVNN
jgi:2,3-bisphosphoglycerate-independent phosphoglycerate mutase